MRFGLGRRHPPGPRGFRRSDERIHDEVCTRLTMDPWIDASEIEVKVDAGEVILEGEVDTREQRWHAEDLVWSVLGVEDVLTRVRVRGLVPGVPPAPPRPHDEPLREPVMTVPATSSRLSSFRTGLESGGVGRRPRDW